MIDMDAILGRTEPFRDEELAVAKKELVETATMVDFEQFRKEVPKTEDLDDDFIDERVAEAMRTGIDGSFDEKEMTIAQMFRKLSPEQKAAVLATYSAASVQGVGTKAVMWIDESKVPDTIRCGWLSVTIIGELGMRGYARVKRTPTTEKWVPNCKQFGTSTWIKNGPYYLCAIPAAVKLAQEADEYHASNDLVSKNDERFRSALRSIAGSIGMTQREVERRDAESIGVIATRGYDPGSPGKADLLETEEETDPFEHVPRPKVI